MLKQGRKIEMKVTKLKQVGSLLTCLLLIAAAAINTNHKIWGHELQGGNKDNQQVKIVEKTDDGSTIIFTKTLAKDIIGYGGNVPLKLYIKGGKVEKIEALPNAESPDFFDMVKKEVLPKWNGKTVDEALKTHVDGVSGATYSSRATIQSVQRGLNYAKGIKDAGNGAFSEVMNLKYAVIILVLLAAAIIPSVVHNKRYRMAQLALNVAVLGLWGGMFISYTLMVNTMTNGLSLLKSLPAILMLVMAFVFPLFGKKTYYCTWVCPMGSMQELIGKSVKRNITIRQNVAKALEYFKEILWAVLVVLLVTGIFSDWMNYEVFAAFMFGQASYAVIIMAIVFMLLSTVITRPYCRFVCPTGTLLHISQNNK